MADENPAPPPAPPGDGGKPPAPAPAPPKPAAPAAAKPAAPPKPKGPVATDASAHPVVARLKEALPDAVLSAKEFVGQVTVEVPAARIVDVCRHLKEREAFTYLVDLTAVDWKERQPRFDVVYWLHSFEKNNERIRLRTGVADAEACPSVSGVWLAANWMEREVFDLFGIVFSGHPDLRRILTWDGFQGHPLRKDFPVEGIDTGAAIYPDRYPDGGGPSPDDSNRKVVS